MSSEILTLFNESLIVVASLLGLSTGLLFWWLVLKD